ncbi:MAG: pseudouridine synthase [Pirellulales bacterium]
MKTTPKKRKVLRHGATSFTGNRRRRRDRSQDAPRATKAESSSASTVATGSAGADAQNVDAQGQDVRDEQRLQKVLAAAGIGSRRDCEELILAGRIEVDGEPVTKLGVRVDSRQQKITVDGEQVRFERRSYYAVNKPTGVLSTNRDPSGRIRVVDLVGGTRRLFTVGRLDQHSDGLIIVTNDGELTQRLTHPKYGVPKTYLVQVAGAATNEVIDKLLAGVHLEEGVAKAARAFIRKRQKNCTVLEMVLTEGRNREIRRMLAQLGHKVQRLTRIAVGPIRLAKLKPGQFRPLDSQEVRALKELAFHTGASLADRTPPGKRPRRTKFKPRRETTGEAARPSTSRRKQRDETAEGKPGKSRRPSAGRPTGGRPAKGRPTKGRPKWSAEQNAAPPNRSTSKPHALPFLKQRLVVDDDEAPVGEMPSRQGKPGRKKPLRRIRPKRQGG